MEARDHGQRQVRGEHGEVAVGEIHDPHHAEHQGKAACEQRVEAAEEDPLDDRVDPLHFSAAYPARAGLAASPK